MTSNEKTTSDLPFLPLKIRPAEEKDIPQLAQFIVAVGRDSENLDLDVEVVKNAVKRILQDRNLGFYLVAETINERTNEDLVIGSLMVTYEISDWYNSLYWWIQSVYVLPSFRNRGVYRSLYNETIQKAKIENVRQVKLYADENNLRANETYRKVGMTASHYKIWESEML